VAPGGRFDLPATIALFAIAATLALLSTFAFAVRDLGASLLPTRRERGAAVRTPSANPLLQAPVLSAVYEQRWALVSWVVGMMLCAAFVMSLARSTADLLRSNATFHAYLEAGFGNDPNVVLLALFWFGLAAFLLATYAITQVALWAADDADGRLEMVIAQPVPRSRVVLERCLTLALASTLIAGVGSLMVAVGAPTAGIHIDGARLLLATALLVPLTLTFGGLGAAIIARRPRWAVPVLSFVAIAGYLLQQVGPLYHLPGWALDFSVFTLYGTPLSSGIFWTGLWAMLAVIVLGFGVGLAAMRYRDVAS
jgi:ABC-2 type transport system permease protein